MARFSHIDSAGGFVAVVLGLAFFTSIALAIEPPEAGTVPEAEAEYPINELPMYGLRDKTAAIRRFNQAWLLDPDNQLALWGFAVTSIDRGDWDAALHYYRMAMESGPENPRLERDYNLALQHIEKTHSPQP